MIEGPRQQPKSLHKYDEEGLASLGLRLERWDILRDTSIPFETRKSNLIQGIKAEIAMLEAQEKSGLDVSQEIEHLLFDLDDVENLSDSEQEINTLYEEKHSFYTEARNNYIRQIE